ncbi:PH domain-containing protein [Eubacteriales bacterium OttesenSCG-928-K08]|nr:PH domain-containing protein [Eubacteriales bacterium OttesenSCG-928-K08]
MPDSLNDAYQPLWKDRKRILGMPISFTRYEVTSDRLILKKGFFRTETNELLLYRILDIKLVRTLSQKIFGVGTIILYSADQSHNTLELQNIKKSDAVRKFLSKIVEQERNSKGITGREIYGAAAGMMGSESGAYVFKDVNGDGIPD